MTPKAYVCINGERAGILSKGSRSYHFSYLKSYFYNPKKPSISLTLSKKKKHYKSKVLFAFFHGLLAEGKIKQAQCRGLKIDEQDYFTRLLKTATNETIGAVTVQAFK